MQNCKRSGQKSDGISVFLSVQLSDKPMLESRVNDLLEAPDAKLVIERAQAILADESNRRRAFREWLRDDVKAEFINGQVIMHSPVKRRHLNATQNLMNLLRNYVMLHDLGEVDSEKALVEMTRNDYEPDICYWNAETAASFEDDQMEHPAPDLIVEVLSKSTTSRDRGIKFEDYAAHGVREYWIIDPVRKSVEQYGLDEATMAFSSVATLINDDTLTALTVSGFSIPVKAIFDKRANMEALQTLLR
jgi:Uma2 family endonuclease